MRCHWPELCAHDKHQHSHDRRLLQLLPEVCTWSVECKLATDGKIGGVGMTVEIDESKFGKRKYQRGRLIEGQWVLRGICRETREIFLVALPENKRDRQTLEPLILEHEAPGSTIITDCWKAYDNLGADGFQHLTINHSYNFVDPTIGAHTNTVENLWWQIKRQLPDTHRQLDTAPVWVHVPVMPVFRKFPEFRIFWSPRKSLRNLRISFFLDLRIKKFPEKLASFFATTLFWTAGEPFGKSPCKTCIRLAGSRTPERMGNYCYHSPAGRVLATVVRHHCSLQICRFSGLR